MKLYVMDCGRIENDLGCLIGLPHQATIYDKNPKADWVQVPIWTVLIEQNGKRILMDTACNPESEKRWHNSLWIRTPYYATEERHFPNVLKRMGLTPKDIDYVVMSHLHVDHGGCLEMFSGSGAEIIVHEDEFMNALKLYALNRDMGPYIRKDIEGWLNADLNWKLIPRDAQDFELEKGVKVLNLGPGHCFGMLGLQVDLEKTGTVILPSDALNVKENMGPPIVTPSSVYDSIGYRKTAARIYELAKQTNGQVWFGHDIKQFETLVTSDNGYYE